MCLRFRRPQPSYARFSPHPPLPSIVILSFVLFMWHYAGMSSGTLEHYSGAASGDFSSGSHLWDEPLRCLCGRVLPNTSAYTQHSNSCKKLRKRCAEAREASLTHRPEKIPRLDNLMTPSEDALGSQEIPESPQHRDSAMSHEGAQV